MPNPDLPARLRSLRDRLDSGLIERGVAVRLALLGALAGEHLIMVGPPGTAKSLVARRLALAFQDATRFEHLLTRFTVPEELFGPLSIKALEQDRYQRQTDGYLPTASVAFLDEVFKANSAILNALLTLLNEREFDNGGTRTQTPLISVVAASNELPESEELDALYDRFLLRLHVGPVSSNAFRSLLLEVPDGPPEVPEELKLASAELQAIQRTAAGITVPEDIVTLLSELRGFLAEQQVQVSDRRWRKILHLLQVSALTNGREAVTIWDCWLLGHTTWELPEQHEVVRKWFADRVGHTQAMDTERLETVVRAWEGRLDRLRTDKGQARDDDGNLLYVDAYGDRIPDERGPVAVSRGTEPLFLAPSPWAPPSHYSPSWQEDRTNGGEGFTIEQLDQVKVKTDPSRSVTFKAWSGRDAYLQDATNRLTEPGSLQPAWEPRRYPRSRLDGLLAEVDRYLAIIDAFIAEIDRRLSELDDTLGQHLWVTDDFLEPARQNLGRSRQAAQAQRALLAKVRKGIDMLPVDSWADELPA